MSADPRTYSRYQILCAEREAWLHGETADGDAFYYDGISFWRSESGGKEAAGALLADARARLAPRGRLQLRPVRRAPAAGTPAVRGLSGLPA